MKNGEKSTDDVLKAKSNTIAEKTCIDVGLREA